MDTGMSAGALIGTLIKGKGKIGFGAGSTVKSIIEYLLEDISRTGGPAIYTSSITTQNLLTKAGIPVQGIENVSMLDVYIDGFDQVDKELNALKSGGGIHTREKIFASMASQFVLVGPSSKFTERFNGQIPVVLEILPDSYRYIDRIINSLFSVAKLQIRGFEKNDSPVFTENGNWLADLWLHSWPEPVDIQTKLKGLTGVIEISLFYQLAHKAILIGPESLTILEKPGGKG
jgi:ribose 5-phosphate isomerase A